MIDINFLGKFCNFSPLIFVISAACRSCRAAHRACRVAPRLEFVDLPDTGFKMIFFDFLRFLGNVEQVRK